MICNQEDGIRQLSQLQAGNACTKRTDDPKPNYILKSRGRKRTAWKGFNSEHLNFIIFFYMSQASFFFFWFCLFVCGGFFFFLWKSVASSESFIVCHNGCGLMPAGYATWLAVRQGWGLFQRAGNYKYLQNRDRQPCCQLSLSDRTSS